MTTSSFHNVPVPKCYIRVDRSKITHISTLPRWQRRALAVRGWRRADASDIFSALSKDTAVSEVPEEVQAFMTACKLQGIIPDWIDRNLRVWS